ncbi:MAG: WYL domain-containing protein [Bacteroidales bacterium]|nr:WYL domain-containing protein [Bacteroidales bacterium]
MTQPLIEKYMWIVDTLAKYRKLSRQDLNKLWMKTRFSNGNPLPERTFHHYRRGIEKSFNIDIACDDYGYYYINNQDNNEARQYTDWILNSNATTTALQELGTRTGRVEMEDVPSAREFLPVVTRAMVNNNKIVFTYAGFTKSRPEVGILFSPYFIKMYKQRWYMYGEKDGGGLRTYALDRVTEMEITSSFFKMPPHLTTGNVFGHTIGITSSKADVRNVVIRTTATRAKYLRALPLHHTQKEEMHDFYSVFTYRLKLNYELVSELMAMGPDVVVVAPRELQIIITDRLRATFDNYQGL